MREKQSSFSVERAYYTVAQVAERWQVAEKTVRRIIEKGKLVAHKFGGQLRISHADLTAYEHRNRMG